MRINRQDYNDDPVRSDHDVAPTRSPYENSLEHSGFKRSKKLQTVLFRMREYSMSDAEVDERNPSSLEPGSLNGINDPNTERDRPAHTAPGEASRRYREVNSGKPPSPKMQNDGSWSGNRPKIWNVPDTSLSPGEYGSDGSLTQLDQAAKATFPREELVRLRIQEAVRNQLYLSSGRDSRHGKPLMLDRKLDAHSDLFFRNGKNNYDRPQAEEKRRTDISPGVHDVDSASFSSSAASRGEPGRSVPRRDIKAFERSGKEDSSQREETRVPAIYSTLETVQMMNGTERNSSGEEYSIGSSHSKYESSVDSDSDEGSEGSSSTDLSSLSLVRTQGHTEIQRIMIPTNDTLSQDARSAGLEQQRGAAFATRASDFVSKIVKQLKLDQSFIGAPDGDGETIATSWVDANVVETRLNGVSAQNMGCKEERNIFSVQSPSLVDSANPGTESKQTTSLLRNLTGHVTDSQYITTMQIPTDTATSPSNLKQKPKPDSTPRNLTAATNANSCGVCLIYEKKDSAQTHRGKELGFGQNHARTTKTNQDWKEDSKSLDTVAHYGNEHSPQGICGQLLSLVADESLTRQDETPKPARTNTSANRELNEEEEFPTLNEALIALDQERRENWDGVSTMCSARDQTELRLESMKIEGRQIPAEASTESTDQEENRVFKIPSDKARIRDCPESRKGENGHVSVAGTTTSTNSDEYHPATGDVTPGRLAHPAPDKLSSKSEESGGVSCGEAKRVDSACSKGSKDRSNKNSVGTGTNGDAQNTQSPVNSRDEQTVLSLSYSIATTDVVSAINDSSSENIAAATGRVTSAISAPEAESDGVPPRELVRPQSVEKEGHVALSSVPLPTTRPGSEDQRIQSLSPPTDKSTAASPVRTKLKTGMRTARPRMTNMNPSHHDELVSKIKEFQDRRTQRRNLQSYIQVVDTIKNAQTNPVSIEVESNSKLRAKNEAHENLLPRQQKWPELPHASIPITGKKVAQSYLKALAQKQSSSIENQLLSAGAAFLRQEGDNCHPAMSPISTARAVTSEDHQATSYASMTCLDSHKLPAPTSSPAVRALKKDLTGSQKALFSESLSDALTTETTVATAPNARSNLQPAAEAESVSEILPINSARDLKNGQTSPPRGVMVDLQAYLSAVHPGSPPSSGKERRDELTHADQLVSRIDRVVHNLLRSGKLSICDSNEADRPGLDQRSLQKNTVELLRNLAVLRSRRSEIGHWQQAKNQESGLVDLENVRLLLAPCGTKAGNNLRSQPAKSIADLSAMLRGESASKLAMKQSTPLKKSNITLLREKRDKAARKIIKETQKLSVVAAPSVADISNNRRRQTSDFKIPSLEPMQSTGAENRVTGGLENPELPVPGREKRLQQIHHDGRGFISSQEARGGRLDIVDKQGQDQSKPVPVRKAKVPPKPELCQHRRRGQHTGRGAPQKDFDPVLPGSSRPSAESGLFPKGRPSIGGSRMQAWEKEQLQKLPMILASTTSGSNRLDCSDQSSSGTYSSEFGSDNTSNDGERLERIENMIQELRERRSQSLQ